MAKRRPAPAPPPPDGAARPPADGEPGGDRTGRYLVLFREGATKAGVAAIREATGLRDVANTADFDEGGLDLAAVAGTPVIVFDKLGVAVVTGDPHQFTGMTAAAEEEGAVLAIEPERIMHVLEVGTEVVEPAAVVANGPLDYLRGFRDGINDLYDRLARNGAAAALEAGVEQTFVDDAVSTWGLKATRGVSSRFSGRGVRVAVLDTGLDLHHPDFLGRSINGRSFIPNEAVQDGHSHGTHCIGTACGPLRPGAGPRYGLAYRCDIFAGKVLSNAGSGPDSSILAGIEWAVTSRCRVVSMSLGSPVNPGETFSPVYENVARRALAAGTLIVAAAGNESGRPGHIAPVGRPANCPSILAVAALDNQFQVAAFSNGGINPNGGGVDIAGPGVRVLSSVPMPGRTGLKSGTSMATPHAAGIAALWSEARGVTGGALAATLTATARRLPLPSRDVGAGLVQAPQ